VGLLNGARASHASAPTNGPLGNFVVPYRYTIPSVGLRKDRMPQGIGPPPLGPVFDGMSTGPLMSWREGSANRATAVPTTCQSNPGCPAAGTSLFANTTTVLPLTTPAPRPHQPPPPLA